MQFNRSSKTFFFFSIFVFLGLSGCQSSSSGKSITIVSPTENEEFTLNGDSLPNTNFYEITIEVVTDGFSEGDDLGLFVNRSSSSTEIQPSSSTTIRENGTATFQNVPFTPGREHNIQVCGGEGCSVSSAVLTIRIPQLCPSIQFNTPNRIGIHPIEDPAANITLGGSLIPGQCDDQFEQTFDVIFGNESNGKTARLFVNGSTVETASSTVQNNLATFENVVLPRRGLSPTDKNTVRVVVQNSDLISCEATLENIYVDCDGPSCEINSPVPTLRNIDGEQKPFLSMTDDSNSELEGFQTQIAVSSNQSANGQPVKLFLNDMQLQLDPVLAISETQNGTFEAIFERTFVDSETPYTVFAVCQDDRGNETTSPPIEWTLDTQECGLQILEPVQNKVFIQIEDPDLFIDPNDGNDDVDPETPGVQIHVNGDFGNGCTDFTEVRIAPTDTCDESMLELDSNQQAEINTENGTWQHILTLGDQSAQTFCIVAFDQARNASFQTLQVNLLTTPPAVQFISPQAGTGINKNGNAFQVVNGPELVIQDRVALTPRCETEFEVACSNIGEPIQLFVSGSPAPISIEGTENNRAICNENPDLEDLNFPGIATFVASVPSINDENAQVTLEAIHTSGRLLNKNTLALFSDCQLPSIPIFSPVNGRQICGSNEVLRPATQDQAPEEEGFQYSLRITPPATGIDMIAVRTEGEEFIEPAFIGEPTNNGGILSFLVNFGNAQGNFVVSADTVDPAGNHNIALCELRIGNFPQFSLSASGENQGIFESDITVTENDASCGEPPEEGIWLKITGQTSATPGVNSIVTFRLGEEQNPIVEEGTFVEAGEPDNYFELCFIVPEVRNEPLVITIVDDSPSNGEDDVVEGRVEETFYLTVDTQAPVERIVDLNADFNSHEERRAGIARLSWTAITDSDGGALKNYEARCHDEPITHDTWENATPFNWIKENGTNGEGTIPVVDENEQNIEIWVSGFVFGHDKKYCTVRGYDIGGRPTPWAEIETVDENEGQGGQGGEMPEVGAVEGAILNEDMVEISTTLTAQISSSRLTTRSLGYAVTNVGDISGDGFNDLLVNAKQDMEQEDADRWEARLYFGQEELEPNTTSEDVLFYGVGSDITEVRVSSVGDFNADGRADFAISNGTPGTPQYLYVFFGRPQNMQWPAEIELDGNNCNADICYEQDPQSVFFGKSIEALNFDGDENSIPDLVIGDTGLNGFDGGLFILRGGTHVGNIGEEPDAPEPLTFLSQSVTLPANIEAANAAPDPLQNGFFLSYSENDDGADQFGSHLLALNDTNNDGTEDLIVGAFGINTSKKLFYLNGRPYERENGFQIILQEEAIQIGPERPDESFYPEGLSAGDFNNDGFTDFAVASTSDEGQITIFFGKPNDIDIDVQDGFETTDQGDYGFKTITNNSNAPNERFGFILADGIHPLFGLIGDINRDGRSDLLTASTSFSPPGDLPTIAGTTELFFGRNSFNNLTRTQANIVFQNQLMKNEGQNVAGVPSHPFFIGDFNGDTIDDFAIGYPNDTVSVSEGDAEPVEVEGGGRIVIFY